MSASVPLIPNTNTHCIDNAERLYIKCINDIKPYLYGMENMCEFLFKETMNKCKKRTQPLT